MNKGDDINPPGIQQTNFLSNSLEHKGPLVVAYMKQANEVVGLQKVRSLYYSLANNPANSKTQKDKFYKLADDVYNKEKVAIEKFRVVSHDNAYEQFLLTNDYKSFEDHKKNQDAYENNSYSRNVKRVSSQIRTLDGLDANGKAQYEAKYGKTDWMKHQLIQSVLPDTNNEAHQATLDKYSNVMKAINQFNNR